MSQDCRISRRDHRPSFGTLYLEDVRSPEVQALTAAQFRVWATLVAHTGRNFANTRLKHSTIGRETCLSVSTVRKALYALRDAGLLAIEARISDDHSQLCNEYTLLAPPSLRPGLVDED